MSLIGYLLGNQPTLGVDIGTTSIKVAEINRVRDNLKLLNYGVLETYGYLDRFNEALQTSSLKLSEETIAAYLKLLLKRAQIKTKLAIASVPAFLTFSTLIEVPPMSENEIRKFMELQAGQYVPLPLNAVAIDWIKVGERLEASGSTKNQVLLVAIPNEQITKYQIILKEAGLKLASVESEGMSLARSAGLNLAEPTLVIDIGGRSTSLSIVQKGFLKFSGQTDFAGGSLTQTTANGLRISQRRAEDLKKQRGLLGFGGEHELSTLIFPILDVIMNEARRVISNYENNYREKVAGVILSGGGANLLGIEDYFNKYFGLPTKKINPLDQLSYAPILSSIGKELGPVLSVAVGLGMKNFV